MQMALFQILTLVTATIAATQASLSPVKKVSSGRFGWKPSLFSGLKPLFQKIEGRGFTF